MKKIIVLIICFVSLYVDTYAITQSQRVNMLNLHNNIRKQFRLPDLIWDFKIERQAQNWANTLAKKNIFTHSVATSRKWMWENIYTMSSYGQKIILDWSDAMDLWQIEKLDYNYLSNSCNDGSICAHYTQIIWKNTKRIGCGQSIQKKGSTTTTYWVCQYDPPGNYIWQKPY